MTTQDSPPGAAVGLDEGPARYVYDFTEGESLGRAILGGKGAGLAHMTSLGLPVPPGFTATCEAGRAFLRKRALPSRVLAEIDEHLTSLEARLGRRLGDPISPLLVSVRSGAAVSMPGMMDTVLNVGLNAQTVDALVRETADERFAWTCYERFVDAYARVVRGIGAGAVEECLMDAGEADEPRAVSVHALLRLIEEHDGRPVPDDPRAQIAEAIAAVFGSWESPRAKAYRRFRGIDDGLATAATVQAMVFGNRGARSGSGVAFTRDPSSGAARPFGDVLFDAQGEDVVAGERDAEPLSALGERLPEVQTHLHATLATIETDARDLCEVEFTVEEGRLWILQTRVGQRSGRAAVRVAVALADEGLISIEEAVDRITPAELEAAAAPGFSAEPDEPDTIARGLAASPGAVSGLAVFDAARAVALAAGGEDVILLRPTTSPTDVGGFIAARGIVTGHGGRTSHAAVVARGMQRPAICGVGDVEVSADRRSAKLGSVTLNEGDVVSVDGDRGILARGRRRLGAAVDDTAVRRFLAWCEERVRVGIVDAATTTRLPVVQDAAGLAAAHARVIVALDDPAVFPAPEAARALGEAEGAPPVLRVSAAWLSAADVRLRGRVAGLVVADRSPAVILLQATLTHQDPP
jgi:pyruvate,orthophosphate dikinase